MTTTRTLEFATGARQPDRAGDQPLWVQLERELRRRLEAGDFDERFPTDHELMEVYEVSRHTVRHAISKLDADGLITRRRGVGTAVDRSRFEQTLGSLYSLFRLVEDTGSEQHSQVLTLGTATHAEAAARLGLPLDAELVHLARLRLADDEPLAIDRVWLPARIGRPLLDVDFSRTALYDELDARVGGRPTAGWERITPAIPVPEDRALLGLPDDVAVFCLQRLASVGEQPFEWRTTLIRGDRFGFVADWSAGQRHALRLAPAEEPAR